MIQLTRLNRQEIAINCDLIAWIEARPDTIVRMLAGESFPVRESVEEIIARIVAYRAAVLREAGLGSLVGAGALGAVPASLAALEHDEDALAPMETAS